MDSFHVLTEVLQRPALLAGPERLTGINRTGIFGYFTGTLGAFMFMRLYSAIPPGVMSFMMVFGFVIALNLLLAAVIHLFMEMTDAPGSAHRLFTAFGYSDYLLTLLLPLGFIAKLNYIPPFVCIFLCAGLVVYARVMLIKRVYPVSVNKALLAIALPYAAFMTVCFFGAIYSLAWFVWLLI
ncbi:MAG TPA: hypothetical protein DCZ92_06990 [Elusimicrobia bacterium]|nr:MAG: hypothetical protein A2016_04975 [Elusimicrobia bacterium GWF2_62_30]HBA60551.1 hypothetical protein [Elusimicrobiota bacterium]